MKKLIIFLILMCPMIIFAETCNNNLHEQYQNYANNITYENEFSKSNKKFTLTIYNVVDGIYAEYNNKKYTPNGSTIKINNIPEGEYVTVYIYGKDGCISQLKTIYENEPYYNTYYGSDECSKYKDKLTLCSSEFLPYQVTKDLLNSAINNYNNSYKKTEKIVSDPEEELTFWEQHKSEIFEWIMKIALAILTTIISIKYYKNKYIKVRHGI